MLYYHKLESRVIKLPGQRIYYVPPRLVGSIADWSGKNAPDGRSWLLDHAQSLGFNTVWFSPFFETTNLKACTGEGMACEHSLYATRQHCVLDPEFSATKIDRPREAYTVKEIRDIDRLDREHIEHFTQLASRQGMHVIAMADLVFNQIAADHPLVIQERADIDAITASQPEGSKPQLITKTVKDFDEVERSHVIGLSYTDKATGAPKEYLFKFDYNEKLEVLDWQGYPGRETAQVNYASPAAKEFFITGANGEAGYWKKVIDWCMDRGMNDFRCDIAYRLPPEWWKELIEHTRQRRPDAVFMAETLCSGPAVAAVKRMAEITVTDGQGRERPGFDLGMVSNYWWNFTDDWLPDTELPRLNKMAKYGGASSPDNHDTPETLAGKFQKALKDQPGHDQMVADICARNYAISALMANSGFMQMGYEYCKEKQNGVFKEQVSPEDWKTLVKERAHKDHVLNISERVKAINALKESLHVDNCRVDIKEHKEVQDGKLIRMVCEYVDVDTDKKIADVVLVINKKPEQGPVAVTDTDLLALESSGLRRMGAAGGKPPVVTDVLVYHTPVEDILKIDLTLVARAVKKAVNSMAAPAQP